MSGATSTHEVYAVDASGMQISGDKSRNPGSHGATSAGAQHRHQDVRERSGSPRRAGGARRRRDRLQSHSRRRRWHDAVAPVAAPDTPGRARSGQHPGGGASRHAAGSDSASLTIPRRIRAVVSLGAMPSRIALVLLAVGSTALPLRAQTGTDPYLARARRVLSQTPLIDGHNDLPWRIREDSIARGNVDAYDLRKHTPGHTDLDRLKKGMIGAQFWSVYTPGEFPDSGYARVQLEQIDIARRFIAKYPDRLALALSAEDIRRDFRQGKIGSLLGLEGGHAIENSLGALRAYY